MIAWVGTGSSMAGSLLVAMGFFLPGFLCFILGSSLWLFVAWREKNKPLFWLNAWFMCCNIIGLYRAI